MLAKTSACWLCATRPQKPPHFPVCPRLRRARPTPVPSPRAPWPSRAPTAPPAPPAPCAAFCAAFTSGLKTLGKQLGVRIPLRPLLERPLLRQRAVVIGHMVVFARTERHNHAAFEGLREGQMKQCESGPSGAVTPKVSVLGAALGAKCVAV